MRTCPFPRPAAQEVLDHLFLLLSAHARGDSVDFHPVDMHYHVFRCCLVPVAIATAPLVVLEPEAEGCAWHEVLSWVCLSHYRPLLVAVQPERDVARQPVHGYDVPPREICLDPMACLVVVVPIVQKLGCRLARRERPTDRCRKGAARRLSRPPKERQP